MNVQCHPEGASSRRNVSEELLIRCFQLTEERDKHKETNGSKSGSRHRVSCYRRIGQQSSRCPLRIIRKYTRISKSRSKQESALQPQHGNQLFSVCLSGFRKPE